MMAEFAGLAESLGWNRDDKDQSRRDFNALAGKAIDYVGGYTDVEIARVISAMRDRVAVLADMKATAAPVEEAPGADPFADDDGPDEFDDDEADNAAGFAEGE